MPLLWIFSKSKMREEYEEFLTKEQGKTNPFFKLWSRPKPFQIFLLICLFFVAVKIMEGTDKRWVWVVVLGLFALYVYSLSRQEISKKVIPRHIAEQIALDDLKKEVSAIGSFPLGTQIIPTGYFKDQTWDSGDGTPKLFKYNIGFKIINPNKSPKEIIYQMNPFTGECKAILEPALPFKGQDIKDWKYFIPERIIEEFKKE